MEVIVVNDKNFDSFRNLKAPQKWIENAINIPQTTNKKAPVFFVKYSRQLATVACLVLVCTLSLAFYFMHDNTAPIAKNPMPTQTKEHAVQNDNQTQNTTHNSNNDNNSNNDKNNSFNIIVPVPDDTKNDNKPEKPTKPQNPSKPNNPQDPSLENPTQAPTQPTQKPTEKPTERPTNPPTQEPTEVRPQKPQKPTEPPTEDPSEEGPPSSPNPGIPGAPSTPDDSYVDFVLYVDTYYADTNDPITCYITDENGNVVVPQTTVYAVRDGNTAYVNYKVYKYHFNYPGYYTCHYVNSYYHYIGNTTNYIS